MVLKLITLGKSKQPLLNEYSPQIGFDDNFRHVTANLFQRIKQTPELLAMLDTAVTDHYLGPVDFFDVNGRTLGPTKLKQVETFWQENNVQSESFYGQGMDLLIDGSGFGWHVSANQILSQKQKEAIVKLKALNEAIGVFAEESANMPRAVSYISASTMSIKHDETNVVYYVQDVNGKRVKWNMDQVVHVKLITGNGEVRGMSTLRALIHEITMMYMLKENIKAKLQNGGSADNIISLINANGNSKARFERLRTALESFSHLKKSHGNMPIDGDVKVHPLGTQLKDMEYRELAMFIISEFALALGLPTSRVPFLMTGSGGSSNKGELSGNSEDSYQTKINSRRTNFENAWNKVFRKAGFTFKFRRTNLQDSVRETQASTQRAAYVIQVQDSLMKAGKQLKLQAHLELLSGTKRNINSDDVEEKEMDMFQQPFGGMNAMPGGQMQPNNKSDSTVGQDRSEAKKKTAFNNGVYT